MYKLPCANQILAELIHALVNSMWNKKEMPWQWKDSIILPIYLEDDKTDKVCISYSQWSEIRRCFITTAFQFCFRIHHQRGSRKSGGTGIEWTTSASGLC
jgi:hypothetical protein